MSELKRDFADFYATAPQPCPYLPDRRERKLFTHLTRDKTPVLIDHMLRTGFRRSQNIAYTPYCDGCDACVSVRVVVDKFEPRRSLRRVIEANRDVHSGRVPNVTTEEQYSLFRDYVALRHSEGGMSDMSRLDFAMMAEDSSIDTFITEYRRRLPGGLSTDFGRWPLMGAVLADRLSDGLSLVYSFYDPEQSDRSLGTFMILEHIAHARKLGLPYVYLGYWIAGSDKMAYKARFLPQERLGPQGWVVMEE